MGWKLTENPFWLLVPLKKSEAPEVVVPPIVFTNPVQLGGEPTQLLLSPGTVPIC
jgi:hypothetical protein